MDCIVHGVTKNRTQPSDFDFHWCPDLQNQSLYECDFKSCLGHNPKWLLWGPHYKSNQTNNPGCASPFWPVMGQRWEKGEHSSPRWAPRRKLSLDVVTTQVAAVPKKAGQRWREYRFPNDTVEPRSQLALKSSLLLDFPMCKTLYCLSH